MEIKRGVTINGCRDCPDLVDVEVGQIEAGLELEVCAVRAQARPVSCSGGSCCKVRRKAARGWPRLLGSRGAAGHPGGGPAPHDASKDLGVSGPGCYHRGLLVDRWLNAGCGWTFGHDVSESPTRTTSGGVQGEEGSQLLSVAPGLGHV